MATPCERYTPETCPCNAHSAARAETRRAQRAAEAQAAQAAQEVKPLEDAKPAEWEPVTNGGMTTRLRVPGGWIYSMRDEFWPEHNPGVPVINITSVFVPDPL